MPQNKNELDRKVKTNIDELFTGVGKSQELFDLKEELTTNLKEKVADYKFRGMDEAEAFKEAVISMGDLSGLVNDMRKIGQDTGKQSVYSTMTARISTAGIVAGVILVLFGVLISTMLYFMNLPAESVSGPGIFIIAGGGLITYSALTRETRRKFGMNKIRAALYALSIGLILFGIFVSVMSGLATDEVFIAISSLLVFFLAGIGLFLSLILSGTDRRKNHE